MPVETIETVYDETAGPPPPDIDLLEIEAEERSFLLRVFAWMFAALVLSAIATDAAESILEHITLIQVPVWPSWVALGLLALAANWVSNKVEKMPGYAAAAALLGFAFINGAIFDVLFRDLTGHSFLPIYLSSAVLFLFICIY